MYIFVTSVALYIFFIICCEAITLSSTATSVKSILPIKPQRWCGFFFLSQGVYINISYRYSNSVWRKIPLPPNADLHMHVKPSYAIFYGIEENKMTFTEVLNSRRFLCSVFPGDGGKRLQEWVFADYSTDAHNSLIQSNTLKVSMPSCYNCISAQGYYS